MQPNLVPINDAGIALGQTWFAINNCGEIAVEDIGNRPTQT